MAPRACEPVERRYAVGCHERAQADVGEGGRRHPPTPRGTATRRASDWRLAIGAHAAIRAVHALAAGALVIALAIPHLPTAIQAEVERSIDFLSTPEGIHAGHGHRGRVERRHGTHAPPAPLARRQHHVRATSMLDVPTSIFFLGCVNLRRLAW